MKNNFNFIIILIIFFFPISIFGQNKTSNNVIKNSNSIKKTLQSKKYSLEFEKSCDLNQDGIEDKILLFKGDTKNYNNEDDLETLDSPIYIILSDGKILSNKESLYTFIPNNSNLDDNIVVKKNYFTVEQTTGNGNNKETQYITFKYADNELLLYKYGSVTTYPRAGKIVKQTEIYTRENFGKIKFENFNIEAIKSKIK